MSVVLERSVVARPVAISKPFLIALAAFAFSMLLIPLYDAGDQLHYRHFYRILPELNLLEGFVYYYRALNSREPVYFGLIWLTSGWMNKDLLMSLVNAMLAYYLARWMVAQRVSWVLYLLLSLNFYLLVLFCSAERLKLALTFIMMASAYGGVWRYGWLGAAVLSHVQTAMLIVSRLSGNIAAAFAPLLHGRLRLTMVWAFVGAFIVAALLFMLREHIMEKLSVYMALSGGVAHLLRPLIFAVFTVYYARGRRFEAFAMQAPLMVAAFIVGGERVVLFCYFVFMYFGLQYNRGLNAGTLLFSTYFFVRGIVFIGDVIQYGDGFPGDTYSTR